MTMTNTIIANTILMLLYMVCRMEYTRHKQGTIRGTRAYTRGGVGAWP